MRVFELAKQLSVPSKDLINDLKTIGVTVSNHMAALEEDAVTQMVNKFGSAKKETSKSAAASVVRRRLPPLARTVLRKSLRSSPNHRRVKKS